MKHKSKEWFDQCFQEILIILEVRKILNQKPKNMNEQIPSIGRIVTYTPTKAEQEAFKTFGCNSGNELPAMIVGVWGPTPTSAVNLKVFVDGKMEDLWKTSISVADPYSDGGYPEGSWHWPVKK